VIREDPLEIRRYSDIGRLRLIARTGRHRKSDGIDNMNMAIDHN
jgi:hypothetical protein